MIRYIFHYGWEVDVMLEWKEEWEDLKYNMKRKPDDFDSEPRDKEETLREIWERIKDLMEMRDGAREYVIVIGSPEGN